MSRRDADGARSEALGVALFALGLLLLLAVVFPDVGAERRNLIGPIGGWIDAGLAAAFGSLRAIVPALAFAWSLFGFGIISRSAAIRASTFIGTLVVALATMVWLADADAEAAGWIGEVIGSLLASGFGAFGALLIVIAALLAVAVFTFDVSVVAGGRRLGALGARGGQGLGRLASLIGAELRGLFAGSAEDGTSRAESLWDDADTIEPEEPEPPEPEPAVDPGGERFAGEEVTGRALTELPPVELLTEPVKRSSGLDKQELKDLGEVLIEKLRTFRVEGRIAGWTTGPVVTQFEVVPAAGVKVGQIAALADDLALALKAPSVRIVAPIPGKGAVGVEVPNPEPAIVYLREILEAPAYRRSRAMLPIALGRDLAGRPQTADLTRMPHLLIAGATGSGKSICINTIITSLIYRHTPRRLRLLLVDPKMVELSIYNDLPHLRHPVVTDNNDAASVLRWAVFEMNRRYSLLSANACRNLREFNHRVASGLDVRPAEGRPGPYDDGELPYVVLVIDELADLIMTVQAEVEGPLAMLAQKARAVGIHLVIATQRPSVNVITGLIKANFPCRIAFRVSSKIDSRTILDQNGAESLLGNGDMLFLPPGEADPTRIQGAFIASEDTERVVTWFRELDQTQPPPEDEADILEVVRELDAERAQEVGEDVLEAWDDLFPQAAEIVVTNSSGSTSLLQRRLKIGYGRAARIIDQLHHAGVLGPPDGSRPREVLVGLEELSRLLDGARRESRA